MVFNMVLFKIILNEDLGKIYFDDLKGKVNYELEGYKEGQEILLC